MSLISCLSSLNEVCFRKSQQGNYHRHSVKKTENSEVRFFCWNISSKYVVRLFYFMLLWSSLYSFSAKTRMGKDMRCQFKFPVKIECDLHTTMPPYPHCCTRLRLHMIRFGMILWCHVMTMNHHTMLVEAYNSILNMLSWSSGGLHLTIYVPFHTNNHKIMSTIKLLWHWLMKQL